MKMARFGGGLAALLMILILWGASAPQAMAQPLANPAATGILVLNQERLYSASDFGLRVTSELEAASRALTDENRQIEAALSAEELRLTAQRSEMTAAEFRPLADEFDTRVEGIRAAQEAKGRALTQLAEEARQVFFEQAFPVLLELVRERGAEVILDTRAVILSAETVDITDDAVERINQTLGSGGEGAILQLPESLRPVPTPAPELAPEAIPADP